MDVKDYYETLGVSRSADQKEIRRAFRKLARKYHPDVNPGDAAAEDRFKEINEAYEVLSDPEKREKYDRFGAQWRQYERMGEQAQDFDWSQWQARPGAGAGRARTVSPEEFEQMFGGSAGGGFSDFFETLFGGGRSGFGGDFGGATGRQPRPQAGRDVEHEVQITLEEAFHGTTRTLQYEGGRQIEARIPPGVKTGSRIRLSGQGQEGFGGGQAGDLYLRVQVLPNDRFERDGADLRTTVDVELYTALLGGDIPVSSIDRTVRLSIPPETGNGRVFRLNGLGMPHVNKPDKRGDLFAEVSVQLPQNLSEREKELFAELQEMRQ